MACALLTILMLAAITASSKAITCYHRSPTISSGTTCTVYPSSSYLSTCYSYSSSGFSYGGCGTCSTRTHEDCATCSTDYCNTQTPSNIKCFSRSTTSSTTNGTMVSCHSLISTCYSYTSGSTSQTHKAGCGNCTVATATISSSCTAGSMCSTNYCNVAPSNINCYSYAYRDGEDPYYNKQKRTCTTNSCYKRIYGEGTSKHYSGGCGSCSGIRTYLNLCRNCYTDYCNSAPAVVVNMNSAAAGAVFLLAVMKLA